MSSTLKEQLECEFGGGACEQPPQCVGTMLMGKGHVTEQARVADGYGTPKARPVLPAQAFT